MTSPTARDVARELDRRQRRRRLLILGGWAVLVVLAALYLRCGGGWGLGGGSGGTGGGSGSAAQAEPPQRCRIHVTAKGIVVDGAAMTADQAVAACKRGADVIIAGDTREGDWQALKAAFEAAHVSFFVRNPQWDAECRDHPLAKPCRDDAP